MKTDKATDQPSRLPIGLYYGTRSCNLADQTFDLVDLAVNSRRAYTLFEAHFTYRFGTLAVCIKVTAASQV